MNAFLIATIILADVNQAADLVNTAKQTEADAEKAADAAGLKGLKRDVAIGRAHAAKTLPGVFDLADKAADQFGV